MKHWKLTRDLSHGSMVRGHMALRNPFGYPSYAGRKLSLLHNPVAAVKQSFTHPIHMDSVYDMAATTVGAIGTYAIPSHWLVKKIPVIGGIKLVNLLLGNAINITLLGTASKLTPWVKNHPNVSKNIVLGGLTMTGLQLAAMAVGLAPNMYVAQKLSPANALAGLGDNDALRAKVREAVARQLTAGRPESASMISTIAGRPEAVTAFKTVGQPKSATSYATVGSGDGLTDDNLNN